MQSPPASVASSAPESENQFENHGLRTRSKNWAAVGLLGLAIIGFYCKLVFTPAASVGAGLLFSLGGYVGQTGWPQMINGAVWAPLVLLFLLRVFRGYRPRVNSIWAGVFLGCAWLSGHHQIPIYTSVTACSLWLWFALKGGRLNVRALGYAAVFLLFTGATGALQILPAYTYGKRAIRFVGEGAVNWNQYVPYNVQERYSLSPASIPGVIFATLHSELPTFVGVVALTLGLFGAAANWNLRVVWLASAIAIAGLAYALGGHNVSHGLLYAVISNLNKARLPQSADFIFDLGLTLLLAFGIDALVPQSRGVQASAKWLAVGGAAAYAVLAVIEVADFVKVDHVIAMRPLVALLLAAILWAWARTMGRIAALACLALLMMIELGAPSGYQLVDDTQKDRTVWLDKIKSNEDVAFFLKRQPGPFRITTDESELSANWVAMQGLETDQGYLGGITDNLTRLDVNRPEGNELLGVRYRVAKQPAGGAKAEAFTGASGLRVFRNDGAFRRAWLVHRVRLGTPPHQIALDQWRQSAFTHDTIPALTTCSGNESVRYVSYTSNESRLAVHGNCEALLMISETWDPEWRASLDGRAAPVLEVNEAMQGVLVPGGAHTIDLKYRPLPVAAGACLTAAALLAACALEWAARRPT